MYIGGVERVGSYIGIDCYTVDVGAFGDYYPFGMVMPGRNEQAGDGYRYSFQGQEHDDEIKGEGNSINYKYRMHDPRVGRFFAVDPLSAKYPHNSPYAFSENSTIAFVELEGLEKVLYYWKYNEGTQKLTALRKADGSQIYSIFQDGTTDYHTVTGVFIGENFEEFDGDVLNATSELNSRGKKVGTIEFDRLKTIGELWDGFKGTTEGKRFTKALGNVYTVAGIVLTGGTLGVVSKLDKVVSIIDIGISVDDLTANDKGETFISKNLTKDQKVLFESVKLAFDAYSKVQSTVGLNSEKLDLEKFGDYIKSNYDMIDGALELKETINE